MTKEILNAELNRGDESLRSANVLVRESLCVSLLLRSIALYKSNVVATKHFP